MVPGSRFAAALGGATGFRASSVSAAVPPTSAKKPLLVLLGDGWRWDAGIFPEFTALWQRAERANVVVRSQSLPTCFAKGVATLAQGKRSAPGASHTTVLGRSLEAVHVNIITAGDVLARSLLGKQDSHHLTDSSFRNADPQVLAQLLRQVVQDSTGNRVVFLDMTLFSTAAQSQVLPELPELRRLPELPELGPVTKIKPHKAAILKLTWLTLPRSTPAAEPVRVCKLSPLWGRTSTAAGPILAPPTTPV